VITGMFKTLNKQLPDLTYGVACRSGHALSNETLTARSTYTKLFSHGFLKISPKGYSFHC
jgi:hypothetical protein